MPNILDLRAKSDSLLQEIEHQLDNYRLEKKKLISIEDSIVESREQLRSVKEAIRVYENANDFRSLIDEGREAEILSFRERMSSLFAKDK